MEILFCTAFTPPLKLLLKIIRSIENEPGLLASNYAVVAICTGTLAGATACLARSLPELLEISYSISKTALQLGIAIQRRAESLAKSSDSWAFTAFNIYDENLNDLINSYNKVRLSILLLKNIY
jgi:starter unit:ACP transacylase-like protein